VPKISVTFKIEPGLKVAAQKVAKIEHRSLTNLVETVLHERCEKLGIRVAEKRGAK
jgi:hypothetical protein